MTLGALDYSICSLCVAQAIAHLVQYEWLKYILYLNTIKWPQTSAFKSAFSY